MYLHRIKGGGARSEEEVVWLLLKVHMIGLWHLSIGKDKPKWEGKDMKDSAVYQR